MDDQQVKEVIGNLVGVITALEMQMQAVLLAAAKAGMAPDDVQKAIDAMPDPAVPDLGRAAYDRAMAGFMWRLGQAETKQDNDVSKQS